MEFWRNRIPFEEKFKQIAKFHKFTQKTLNSFEKFNKTVLRVLFVFKVTDSCARGRKLPIERWCFLFVSKESL
jgi:hypothetical protein